MAMEGRSALAKLMCNLISSCRLQRSQSFKESTGWFITVRGERSKHYLASECLFSLFSVMETILLAY